MPRAPHRQTAHPDLAAAQARWGGLGQGALLRASDLRRLWSRRPLAVALMRAAATDPAAFWTTAVALRRHRALQKPLELFAYLRFLRSRQPRRVLEIGTLWGGTFYAHSRVSTRCAHLIAVDGFPRESTSRMTERFRSLALSGQQVTCFWGSSHDSAVTSAVAGALGDQQLDLLFLDGDHTADGIRQDYDTYSPFVRKGGLIAIHDIDAGEASGVSALWQALRRDHESLEFVDRHHPPEGLGIGVIVKR